MKLFMQHETCSLNDLEKNCNFESQLITVLFFFELFSLSFPSLNAFIIRAKLIKKNIQIEW